MRVHCVVTVKEFEVQYLGTDEEAAGRSGTPHSVRAIGRTVHEALRSAIADASSERLRCPIMNGLEESMMLMVDAANPIVGREPHPVEKPISQSMP
jgi:hypothetical protein